MLAWDFVERLAIQHVVVRRVAPPSLPHSRPHRRREPACPDSKRCTASSCADCVCSLVLNADADPKRVATGCTRPAHRPAGKDSGRSSCDRGLAGPTTSVDDIASVSRGAESQGSERTGGNVTRDTEGLLAGHDRVSPLTSLLFHTVLRALVLEMRGFAKGCKRREKFSSARSLIGQTRPAIPSASACRRIVSTHTQLPLQRGDVSRKAALATGRAAGATKRWNALRPLLTVSHGPRTTETKQKSAVLVPARARLERLRRFSRYVCALLYGKPVSYVRYIAVAAASGVPASAMPWRYICR